MFIERKVRIFVVASLKCKRQDILFLSVLTLQKPLFGRIHVRYVHPGKNTETATEVEAGHFHSAEVERDGAYLLVESVFCKRRPLNRERKTGF